MKKIIKLLSAVFVLAILALLAVSCTQDVVKTGYKVTLLAGTGAEVTSENPQRVEGGGTATFTVNIKKGYMFVGCDGGTYNQETGVFTVENVTANTVANLYTKPYEYDPDATFDYFFDSPSKEDVSTPGRGLELPAGLYITVEAKDTTRKFEGWSFNTKIKDPSDIVSTDRVFSFNLSQEYARMGVIRIYANYSDYNKLVYDANGGSINQTTVNMQGNAHSTVTVDGSLVTATYSDEYLSFFECGSSFWDDGSFYKSGAVLKEYNTKPDGTGEAYSLGSKVPLTTSGAQTVLYCIWADETPVSDFEYTEITMAFPLTKAENVPDWNTSGVTITGYYGNAETVVIPEYIDGKPVIAISAGAFSDCSMKTLVMGNNIQRIEDGAFTGCAMLSTVYYPDSIYYITNESFDAETTAAIKQLNVNATMAPRYSSADVGGLAVKMSRLLAPVDVPRIIIIAGSSSYQGLGTEYMEALLKGKYRVINFGTTRTTHGFMYLEAMGALANENDIILYAPENSSYMFGERELYFKTYRDFEGMINVYRYVDMSQYTNVFGAFHELNEYRYAMAPITYEGVCERARESEYNANRGIINKYGDYLKNDRDGTAAVYYDSYHITLNEYIKSKYEGAWNNVGNQQANSNYLDPNNNTWCRINDPYYADSMNRVINIARSSGAAVYFSFCPVDETKLVDGADSAEWLAAYDKLILDTYAFDGIVGTVGDYVFATEYFYDNAFHLNDYGRTYRTYRLYFDLCEKLGITDRTGMYSVGEMFDGCLFDGGTAENPKHPTDIGN